MKKKIGNWEGNVRRGVAGWRVFSGFTLIELLVVIAVIAILAGLVLSTAGFIQKKGAMARAQAEIEALSTALESYKVEYGDYPQTNSYTGSNGSQLLYNALVLSNASLNPLGKVFFEPSKGMLKSSNFSDTANYFVDPFGSPYQYRAGSAATNSGTNFFDLWSYAGAATNETNAPKWIKNW